MMDKKIQEKIFCDYKDCTNKAIHRVYYEVNDKADVPEDWNIDIKTLKTSHLCQLHKSSIDSIATLNLACESCEFCDKDLKIDDFLDGKTQFVRITGTNGEKNFVACKKCFKSIATIEDMLRVVRNQLNR
jgi:hypothetical protein